MMARTVTAVETRVGASEPEAMAKRAGSTVVDVLL